MFVINKSFLSKIKDHVERNNEYFRKIYPRKKYTVLKEEPD